jgi:hypothetical protein
LLFLLKQFLIAKRQRTRDRYSISRVHERREVG